MQHPFLPAESPIRPRMKVAPKRSAEAGYAQVARRRRRVHCTCGAGQDRDESDGSAPNTKAAKVTASLIRRRVFYLQAMPRLQRARRIRASAATVTNCY